MPISRRVDPHSRDAKNHMGGGDRVTGQEVLTFWLKL